MNEEILKVTPEGEFVWHQIADELIDSGDFSGAPSVLHILRRLRERDRLAAENEALKANLDRHMEVIMKGRAANEALNREIVATKMLAGNPQAIIDLQKELAALKQASEPVAEAVRNDKGYYELVWKLTDRSREIIPLYLHPAPSDRDAERYRWLREGGGSKKYAICEFNEYEYEGTLDWYALGFKPESIDAAIDAAMEGGK